MRKFILIFIIFSTHQLQAQEPIAKKSFLIIYSSKDYNSALKLANEAREKLNLEINLRGYYEDKEDGLKTDSVCGCGETHGYIPRGRFDDGEYISIEHSNHYKKFTSDYYIVVISSAEKGDNEQKKLLKKTKKIYKSAYIKSNPIWMGCMH